MKKALFFGLACMFTFSVSLPLMAAKLYKIVDENGNVTFSQFPPEEKRETEIIEDVHVRSSGSAGAFKPQVRGENVFCDKLQLTSYQYKRGKTKADRMRALQESLENWQRELTHIEKSLEAVSQNQFNKDQRSRRWESDDQRDRRFQQYMDRKERIVKRAKQYRCAVNWGEENLEHIEPTHIDKINEEVVQLRRVMDALERKQIENCGEEPVFDLSKPHLKYQYEQWQACAQPFESDKRKVKNRMRKISASIY